MPGPFEGTRISNRTTVPRGYPGHRSAEEAQKTQQVQQTQR